MQRYFDFLQEQFTDTVTKEDKRSGAARQAAKLQLKYVGFGRYANKKHEITHVVQDGKLVPFVKDDQLSKLEYKPNKKDGKDGSKQPEHMNVSAQHGLRKTIDKNYKETQKKLDENLLKTHKELCQFYPRNIFTKEELDAIHSYSAEKYADINRYLYTGKVSIYHTERIDDVKQQIAILDQAFEEAGSPFNYTVYAGLNSKYKAENFASGKEYIFRGFISTSLDNTIPMAFIETDKNKSSVILEMKIKTGQKAIYLGALQTALKSEYETLLPRGTKIRVISGPHTIPIGPLNSNPYDDIDDKLISLFKCEIVDE